MYGGGEGGDMGVNGGAPPRGRGGYRGGPPERGYLKILFVCLWSMY